MRRCPEGESTSKRVWQYFHSEAERRTWLQGLVTHYMEQAEDRLIEELIGPRYEPEEELC